MFLVLGSLQSYIYSQSLQDGLKAIENEKYEQAKQILNSLIASNASYAGLYFYYGNVCYLLSQTDSSKYYYSKGIAVNSKQPENYIGMGKLMLDEKNAEKAKINFDKAFTLSSLKDVKINMLVAEAYITSKNKDVEKAVALLNKILPLDKNNADIHILIGDAYIQLFDGGGKAMSSYERAVEINPKSAKAYYKIGQLYTRIKIYSDALKAFQNSINADAAFIPAYRDLAELYYQAKKYNEAVATFKKYLESAEVNVNNLTRYASFLFLAKDYPSTITVINQIKQLDATNPILYRLIGYSYFEQGKYQEGLEAMKNFFTHVDSSKLIASDFEYLGKLQSKTSNDSLAIINLKKAIALDSSKAELHIDVAQIYYQRKQYIDAAKEYEFKAEKIPPKSQDYFLQGRAYYFAQEYSKADSAFVKVSQIQPNSHFSYLWRGRIFVNVDTKLETDSAKNCYEKCIELAIVDSVKYKKDLVESYSYLGYYFLQKDNNVSAKSYYTKVLELDPENKDAKTVINSLK